ncbi:histidine phosphatase family protein [Abyssibius alkaniclasticus]|uniref:histidine phosphatase family protein n=1 Tax=Abyssibius alkaniclasticus TaxID=2881234 RepID=UPI0023634B7E|nr:histidine phosphatase family protein [Abyssibius alkaniclasticus]UPH72160.1 histidine phosphatase family protein [Abyssibius alkaniclasticus]
MSLRLWLVRHGPTHAKAPVGWRDLPADLSDGAAIARLRAALPEAAPLISSDLGRAVTTGDTLVSGARLAHDAALREINFGRWDGVPHDALPAVDAPLARRFWEQPGDIAPPEGESWNMMAARVAGAVDRLCASNTGDLVIVAHFGALLSIIQRAAAMPPAAAFSFTLAPLSLSRVDYLAPGKWRVERVNHCP